MKNNELERQSSMLTQQAIQTINSFSRRATIRLNPAMNKHSSLLNYDESKREIPKRGTIVLTTR